MNAQSVILLILLAVILIPGVKHTIAHLKGDGACCGGPKERPKKKVIKGTKLSELKIPVEGMHCVNCKYRIENHLNALDGVVAKVNMEKKLAVVSLYARMPQDRIIKVIEDLGYHVPPMP